MNSYYFVLFRPNGPGEGNVDPWIIELYATDADKAHQTFRSISLTDEQGLLLLVRYSFGSGFQVIEYKKNIVGDRLQRFCYNDKEYNDLLKELFASRFGSDLASELFAEQDKHQKGEKK